MKLSSRQSRLGTETAFETLAKAEKSHAGKFQKTLDSIK